MKNMNTMIRMLFLVVCIGSVKTHATPILSFEGAGEDIVREAQIADTFTLSLWISNLAPDEDLGGFDISAVVGDTSLLGNNLIDVYLGSPLSEFDLLSLIVDDTISLTGISFAFDLSQQADAFELLSFDFLISEFGTTTIEITDAVLSDAFGFAFDFDTFSATVIVDDPNRIDSPPSLALMLLMLLGLIRRGHNSVKA